MPSKLIPSLVMAAVVKCIYCVLRFGRTIKW